MKFLKNNKLYFLLILIIIALSALLAWKFASQTNNQSGFSDLPSGRNYYLSFSNDYFFEVPYDFAVNDTLLPGSQFLYKSGAIVKTNTLDDLFGGGAIAVQNFTPFNTDKDSFESYINGPYKDGVAKSLSADVDVSFSDRDEIRFAKLTVKKDNKIVRVQYILNSLEPIIVVAKEDSENLNKVWTSVNNIDKYYKVRQEIKSAVLSNAHMIKNRMADDIYRLSSKDLQSNSTIDQIDDIIKKSADVLKLESVVTGATVKNNELYSSILFSDPKDPANNKAANLNFRKEDGKWKLITLIMPGGGSVTGIKS